MNKTFVGAVILFTITIGFLSFANAEIDPRFADEESECAVFEGEQELKNGTLITRMMDCKWVNEEFIPRTTNATATQPDLTDEEIEVIKDAIKCRSDPECNPPDEYVPPFNPNLNKEDEEDREELIKQNTERACLDAEKETDLYKRQIKDDYCNSWSLATACEQGVNEAQPAQGYRKFLTTEFILNAWRHYDYENEYWLVTLQKAGFECIYQKEIVEGEFGIFGPRYENIRKATEFYEHPYHADKVTRPDYRVQSVGLTQAVFENHENNVFNTFCSKIQFKALWAGQGCPVKKVDDTCKMPTDKQLIGLNSAGLYNPRQLDGTLLPIKDYYIQKQVECIEKAKDAQSKAEQRMSFGEYLQTLEPLQNAKKYNADPINAYPIGVTKSHIIVQPGQGSWVFDLPK